MATSYWSGFGLPSGLALQVVVTKEVEKRVEVPVEKVVEKVVTEVRVGFPSAPSLTEARAGSLRARHC